MADAIFRILYNNLPGEGTDELTKASEFSAVMPGHVLPNTKQEATYCREVR
jgi:hypothetical protein